MSHEKQSARNHAPRRIEWNAVTAMVAAIALAVSATGTWYAGAELRMGKRIARLEFLRQYYQQCQEFNDVQEKLVPNGEWYGPGKGPMGTAEWFRVERYMGLLEQVDRWYHDGLLELVDLDRSYSHRVKALWAHPWIRKTCLEDQAFRWEAFNDLAHVLEQAPIYSKLPDKWEDTVPPFVREQPRVVPSDAAVDRSDWWEFSIRARLPLFWRHGSDGSTPVPGGQRSGHSLQRPS